MEGEEGFRRAVARLAELTRDPEVPVIFIVPDQTAEPWSLAVEASEAYGFEILELGSYLGAYLVENGFENTRDGWRQAFWLSEKDRHPNPPTHELYARALFDKLVEMGIVKQSH